MHVGRSGSPAFPKFIRYLSVAEPTEKGLHKAVKVSTEVYITPPDEYKKLDDEFRFEFDACPYPRPRGFNALKILWKKTNFVNPPFSAKHNAEPDHHGPTDYVRKAIAEQRLGNTSVLTLRTPNYVNMLIEAGAEVWALGRIKYLEAKTGKPHPNPPFITRFVLRGHSNVKSS